MEALAANWSSVPVDADHCVGVRSIASGRALVHARTNSRVVGSGEYHGGALLCQQHLDMLGERPGQGVLGVARIGGGPRGVAGLGASPPVWHLRVDDLGTCRAGAVVAGIRSEEHTYELQSRQYLV